MLKNFGLFLTGQTLSCLGDVIGRIALSWLVYDLTGSLIALGSMALAGGIPQAIVRFLGAPILDRFDRIKLMVLLDFIRFGLYLIAPLLHYAGSLHVWHLYILAAAAGAIGALFDPAADAVLPSMVPAHKLLRANSIQGGVIQATTIIGPVVAGIIVAKGNAALGLLIDAFTFGISAIILLLLPNIASEEKGSAMESSYIQEMIDGFKFFVQIPALGILAAIGGLANLGIYAIVTLLTAYVKDILKMEASAMGILHSLWGIGFILGSMFMGWKGSRIKHRTILLGGLFAVGIVSSLLSFVTPQTAWVAFILLAVWGFSIGCFNITYSYLCQTLTPSSMQGRAAVARSLVMEGSNSVGSGGGAAFAETAGIRGMYLLAGLIPAVAALSGLLFRQIRDLDKNNELRIVKP